MSRAARAGWALAAFGVLAIAALTLGPDLDATGADPTPLYCLVCGDRGGVDVVLNLLLFMPFGAGLRLGRCRWRAILAASAVLSLSVELLQLTVVTGRDASLSDLLSNTTGGAIGAATAARLNRLVHPAPSAARRLFTGAIIAWLGLFALSAWLQPPDVPEAPLSSHWAGRSPLSDSFDGRVLAARLNDVELPADGELPPRGGTRAALAEGRFSLDARIVSGPPPGDSRWIYLIRTSALTQLFLGQQKRELVFEVPARALRFRLNPPTLVLADAMPADSGQAVRIRAGQRDLRLWLASEHAGGSRGMVVPLSPARGWVMIAPFGFGLGPWLEAITALVVAALALPPGYWGAATARPRETVSLLAAALVVGLAVIPAAAGYPPVHWSEWAAGTAGTAAGWALRRAAAYLQLRCGSPSISESFSS